MRNSALVALSGAALLHVATAACCRSNTCLKAVALQADVGVADCSSNLAVTVTPSPVIVTKTATLMESAVETDLFTETTTAVASTETLLFTETTTITASTATNTVGETITVPYTTTVFATAAPVTTTSYMYETYLKARDVATETPSLPEYATASCADWDMYVKACKCAGAEPATVTAEPATFTVTVPADDALTTTVGTVSSTQTDTVYLTATTSVTATDAATVVQTVTVTQTATESSVASAVQATQTPSVVVPLACRPAGEAWRASNPFTDGSTRVMNVVSSSIIAWQSFAGNAAPAAGTMGAQTSVWIVNSAGFLENRYTIGANSEVLVAYMDTTATAATVQVKVKARSAVEAGVAAGTMEKVRVCVGAADNKLHLTSRGRSSILSCGNGLMLSTNRDGKDYRSDCLLLNPSVTLF